MMAGLTAAIAVVGEITDDTSCLVCSLCTVGTTSSDSVHAITRQLLSDATMTPWLDDPPEIATGAVAIASK